ncbi:uncharacterized protein LOC122264399 [Penaeus japonicus]|uniref:uncharacterized protein LOC122264399 n=1 Tax=Penaeus japonicus TaxID=27405 RepID=UPI001C716AF0|nr:uncharacterized protein LOC122264399 [Penaeus japonicus]
MGAGRLLAVLAAALALAEGHRICTSLTCPEPNGLFAHPTDCHHYVKCSNGHAYAETCPANLYFNEASGSCDHPENAKCDINKRLETEGCSLRSPKARSLPGETDFSVECDCDCCMKPHKDCNKYYECKDNVAYVKECGGDLVFNPALEQCDLPTNYECPKPVICGCHCRYPVDGECNAYYDCRNGEAEKKYCTEGLLFNPDTRMCDIAENVDCPATPPTEPPPGCHDNVHDSDPDCKFWAANNDCHCKWTDGDCSWQHFVARACPRSCACQGHVNATSRPVIDFPCVNCSSGQQYWQHPSDCRKFIQCAPYGPQEMPCGEGTVWDQNLLTCNHEWATQCLTGNYLLGDGSCSGCSGCTPPAQTTARPSQKPVTPGNFSCVDCSTGQQYWQHPSDCHKFIQCAPYGPQEMPCPAGTRWDQKILTCNHEWNTPCVTGNYRLPNGSCSGCTGCPDVIPPRPDGCSGDHPDFAVLGCQRRLHLQAHSDCTWQNQVAAMCPKTCRGECGQTTPPTGGCNFVCPSYSGLFPHPKDCTKWVHCDHFIPRQVCPPLCTSTQHLRYATGQIVQVAPQASMKAVLSPPNQCPPALPPHPATTAYANAHIPPAEDCTSYYYCDVNRNKTFHTCSPGLVFNPEMGTCVFADEYPQCVTEKPPVSRCDCVNRVPEKKECPSGLLWNQKKKSCDLPLERPMQHANTGLPTTISASGWMVTTFGCDMSTENRNSSFITMVRSPHMSQGASSSLMETIWVALVDMGFNTDTLSSFKDFDRNSSLRSVWFQGKNGGSVGFGDSLQTREVEKTAIKAVAKTDGIFSIEIYCRDRCDSNQMNLSVASRSTDEMAAVVAEVATWNMLRLTTENMLKGRVQSIMSVGICHRICTSLTCPEPNGLFAHPTDCHRYVKCSNGHAYAETFPPTCTSTRPREAAITPRTQTFEMKINTTSSFQCDINKRLEAEGCSLRSPKARSLPGETDFSVECDCDCCMKPHKDCNKYYECKDNVAYVKECGGDLVFNPALEQCDLPTNYECPKPIFCGCHCRYPVDGECNAYYDCRDSEAEKKYTRRTAVQPTPTCVTSLKMSTAQPRLSLRHLLVVMTTSTIPMLIAVIKYQPVVTIVITLIRMTCQQPDCKFWAANNDCHCKWTDGDCSWQHFVARACPRSCACQGHVNATSRPVIDFPCVDCSSGQQYWQHPSDCRKFIQCAPYGPQEMPCPAGTRWDQKILTCNHERDTPCVTGNYLLADGSCSGCTGCPPPPTADPGSCSGENPDCKFWAANGDCTCKPNTDCYWQNEVARMCPKTCRGDFPHPKDCTKWVHCDHFTPHVKDCPANLHFNPTLKVCDWPAKAGCTSSENSGCVIPPDPIGPTTDPDPICTCECCHIQHPEDCTSYYYCDVNKNKTFHTCSFGLVFHPESETCVYAAEYPQCVIEPPPKCECDCHYASEICSEYYICNNGVPEKKECSSGLLWNQAKYSCDLPENVQCNIRRN